MLSSTFPVGHASPLRTGDSSVGGPFPFQQPMLSIHDRPFPAAVRFEAGHWDRDLIIGDNHLPAIGTVVERKTRMVSLVHLLRIDADSLHTALVTRMQDLPPTLMRSIAWDQGTRMARRLATADRTRRLATADRIGRRSTSATPVHPGNVEPTKRLMDFCATTSPRASAAPVTRRVICLPSNMCSTTTRKWCFKIDGALTIRHPANITNSVGVAALTRTHPAATGGFSTAVNTKTDHCE